MKKIFQFICLIILFSIFFYGCAKEKSKNEHLYTPYTDVINPPDSFVYYISLSSISFLQGKIQFKEDAVWHITKTSGFISNTWLSRSDKTTIFGIAQDDTVALQGNILYLLSASYPSSQDRTDIYLRFTKLPQDYQSFSSKY